jgi:hypothetical protein
VRGIHQHGLPAQGAQAAKGIEPIDPMIDELLRRTPMTIRPGLKGGGVEH